MDLTPEERRQIYDRRGSNWHAGQSQSGRRARTSGCGSSSAGCLSSPASCCLGGIQPTARRLVAGWPGSAWWSSSAQAWHASGIVDREQPGAKGRPAYVRYGWRVGPDSMPLPSGDPLADFDYDRHSRESHGPRSRTHASVSRLFAFLDPRAISMGGGAWKVWCDGTPDVITMFRHWSRRRRVAQSRRGRNLLGSRRG